jgi:hypothetical protein
VRTTKPRTAVRWHARTPEPERRKSLSAGAFSFDDSPEQPAVAHAPSPRATVSTAPSSLAKPASARTNLRSSKGKSDESVAGAEPNEIEASAETSESDQRLAWTSNSDESELGEIDEGPELGESGQRTELPDPLRDVASQTRREMVAKERKRIDFVARRPLVADVVTAIAKAREPATHREKEEREGRRRVKQEQKLRKALARNARKEGLTPRPEGMDRVLELTQNEHHGVDAARLQAPLPSPYGLVKRSIVDRKTAKMQEAQRTQLLEDEEHSLRMARDTEEVRAKKARDQ